MNTIKGTRNTVQGTRQGASRSSSTRPLKNNIKDYDNKELEFKDNGDRELCQRRQRIFGGKAEIGNK
jgi:hypothetical protein